MNKLVCGLSGLCVFATWFITYDVMRQSSLTPQRTIAIQLLARTKALCEARAFNVKQLQAGSGFFKADEVKRLQLKYASVKGASDNLISLLVMKVLGGISDKDRSLDSEIKEVEAEVDSFIKLHDDLLSEALKQERLKESRKVEGVPLLDGAKLAFEVLKELSDIKTKADEQLIGLIQKQTLLGFHEFNR